MRAKVVSCEDPNLMLTSHNLDQGHAAAHSRTTMSVLDQSLIYQSVRFCAECIQEAARRKIKQKIIAQACLAAGRP